MPRGSEVRPREQVARRIFLTFLLAAGLPLALLAGWTLFHVNGRLTDEAGSHARDLAKAQGMEMLGRLQVAVEELETLASLVSTGQGNVPPRWTQGDRRRGPAHWEGLFRVAPGLPPWILAGEADTRLDEVIQRLPEAAPPFGSQLIELSGSGAHGERRHYLLVPSAAGGWVGGRLSPAYLWDLDQLGERADALCYLDGQGNVLVCNARPSRAWIATMRQAKRQGTDGWISHTDGEASLVSALWPFVLAPYNSDQEWSVAVGLPTSEVLAPVALFSAIFPQVVLITLAVVALLSLYVIRGNLRPLGLLLQATRRVQTGALDVKVDLPRRDEFQELGLAFNEMTQALDRQFRYLSAMAELGRQLQGGRSFADTLAGFLRALPAVGSFDAAGGVAVLQTERSASLILIPMSDRRRSVEDGTVLRDAATLHLAAERWFGDAEAARSRFAALERLDLLPDGQCLVLPVVGHSRVVANLVLVYAHGAAPGREELANLERMADFLAIALQKAQLDEQLAYRAGHDMLTGLASRDALIEHLDASIGEGQAASVELALVMVHIDSLRSINDAHGHLYSDQVLVEIGRRLRRHIGESEVLSRFDGGTFVALLLGEAAQSARARAAGFVAGVDAALSTAVVLDGREFHVAATKGGAFFPRDAGDATGLLRRADAALHEARRRERGRLMWFGPALEHRIAERHQAEQSLRYAIAREELNLCYQPISDPNGGTIVGAESLVRWERPGFGVVSPEVFVPLAEETGLIEAIGSWTLRRACWDFQGWRRRGLKLPYLSVNVSGIQLVAETFARQVAEILKETGLAAERLVLEVTETALIGRLEACLAQLEAVRRLGVRVAIDDFGTGYASLKYVKQLPADIFKIDRLFVSGLPDNRRDLAIVSTVRLLAEELGADLIAEGVETAAQVAVLADLGIRKLQGYYYSEPLEAREFLAYLTEHQPSGEMQAFNG